LLPVRFRAVLTSFLQQPGLAFAEALPEERILAAFAEERVSFANAEDDIYTPAVTLWAFLSQALFKGEQRSCVAAVSRVNRAVGVAGERATLARHGRLLSGPRQAVGSGASPVNERTGGWLRARRPIRLALAWTARQARGRHYAQHA
jgi:hypothetical protein